ncbi:MAG: alpha/beta fold hydrolase [Thermomicrobiales bacterium]|nr:alpha/beta fold hydrolase [Thermomicrobiales bacterium]MCO5221398.1 lipase family protein [Thermomicrobiales bacterium]
MRRIWWNTCGLLLILVLASTGGVGAVPPLDPPEITRFYDAPETLPQEPGTLIRWEAIDNPKGDASLYRILYTSTDVNGTPISVSGAIAIPAGSAPGGGFPLVASAHGMVGAARGCAPSLALFEELEGQSFWSMQLQPYLDAGYAVVMPDYQGAGAAGPASNVVGIVEAHNVLDAVRAARNFTEAKIAGETFLWGHSQGGHAALFTNAMAADYAPDVAFTATAVLAPAIDLEGIFTSILASDKPVSRSVLALIVARAWTDTYPNQSLDDILTLEGRAVVEHSVDRYCIPWVGVSSLLFAPRTLIKADAVETWAHLIAQNTPGAQPEHPPIFIGHGAEDEVIPIAGSEQYVKKLCAAGTPVTFEPYPGATHFSVVSDATQDVVDFFTSVRSGAAPRSTCTV